MRLYLKLSSAVEVLTNLTSCFAALIPPSTFLQVLPVLASYTLPPIHMRTFTSSGLSVLHTPPYSKAAFASRMVGFLTLGKSHVYPGTHPFILLIHSLTRSLSLRSYFISAAAPRLHVPTFFQNSFHLVLPWAYYHLGADSPIPS